MRHHRPHSLCPLRRVTLLVAGVVTCALIAAPTTAQGPSQLPRIAMFDDPTGFVATYSTAGRIDLSNPFFTVFGINGRSCGTCHQPATGWTVTPANVRARFAATGGKDPIFRSVDGSVSPDADVSTVAARRIAFRMLLTKALIRVGMPIPPNAEFTLAAVDDPYGYASAAHLSLFRRPLPATNLSFLSTVMWDGRETFVDPTSTQCLAGNSTCFASLHFDLADQANGATLGHAQAAGPLTEDQQNTIVAFESSLYTAQIFDDAAGMLTARGAQDGPIALAALPFYFGINDVLAGDYRTGPPSTRTCSRSIRSGTRPAISVPTAERRSIAATHVRRWRVARSSSTASRSPSRASKGSTTR